MAELLLYLFGVLLVAAAVVPESDAIGFGLALLGVVLLWAGFARTIRKVPPQ